ncbi:OLE1 Fatty-acid desaturase [uncultured Caudovirales phage]|uniref:OLE1 Fatty-acid desaturase n=1 Tax=uncultured Caudovirales phage TaxID=2100421 RepID=A0A6J5L3Y4_9CAUD|nr:OLE1 Fatty-acid desaturase [uncultured Caudovirales phage]
MKHSMSRHTLFAMQLFCLLGLVAAPFVLTVWELLAAYCMFIFLSIVFSVTNHRLLSHRAFQPTTFFKYAGPIISSMCAAGSPLAWSSLHLDHHRYPDKPQDPHSPHHKASWQIYFLSPYFESKSLNKRLLVQSFHRFLHRWYFTFHAVLIVVLTVISVKALIIFYLMPNALLLLGLGVLGSDLHRYGYRNFQIKDQSRNNIFWWPLLFGETWHNNHHARPKQAKFGVKWWEIDPQHWFTRLVTAKAIESKETH